MNVDKYDSMDLEELKSVAKDKGLVFGKIGKDKLIEKIREIDAQSDNVEIDNGADSEINVDVETDTTVTDSPVSEETAVSKENEHVESLVASISSAIDGIEGAEHDYSDDIVDLSPDTIVNVKSITYGGLIYRSRATNAVFRWNNIGAVNAMTVAEITEMNNFKSSFLNAPLVILMDDKAVKKFRLTSVYENVAKINDLGNLFQKSLDVISSTIDIALSVHMRDVLISKVRQMYKSGSLTNIKVIHLLENKLQCDFSDVD